ncbi:endolytic transglycosylase MltG [Epidermidibacterium keratini]|uniref:Endolytic murein transglycosylase n=1 Tax=Epidermidibacterium keratini TaxID=1891644 RepID=A0A7L4YIS6_9ACTN|nr:endolytic transglycosylase MltG [Epidermidibacterium keratini]QHB99047.1 endolytic transglycosylase MltG [Epidermidibacterium keratini]
MSQDSDRHRESGVDGLGALIADDIEDQSRPRSERRRRRRRPLITLVAFIIVAAIVVFAVFFARDIINQFRDVPDYTGSGKEAVQVTVDPGDSLSDIAQKLVDADVVKSARAFTDAAEGNDAAKSIQPGTYQLKTQMKATLALDTLLGNGSKLTQTVTIIEGQTVAQTIAKLSEATGIPLADFEAALADRANLGIPAWVPADVPVLEGLISPGTYEFQPDDTALTILQSMVAHFTQRTADLGIEQKAAAVGLSPYDVLKVASLIETEIKIPDERSMAARVIYNRLAAGEALGIDASTAYGVGKKGNELTTADLQDPNNPYNLRIVPGLPPTPISGFGDAAVEAALNPAEGTWKWYVVNSADGTHTFVSTYEEFLAARQVCQQNGWC